MKKFLVLLTVAALPLTSSALSYKFSPEKSDVKFSAKSKPSVLTITGEGKGVTGSLKEEKSEVTGQLEFPLSNLKTGIDMRDDHMKNKYLEVGKFPVATLKFDKFKKPADTSKSFPFTGTLTIKGETKPVSGTATMKEEGKVSKVDAEFGIKLSDYPAIGTPGWKGVTVSENVTVKVAAEASKE